MIWLIGNKGMLGSDVEIELVRNCIEYVGTDREVDITDEHIVLEFCKKNNIHWIINCAAYTAVDKAEDEEERAFAINATGAGILAKAADTAEAKLIHVSTDYVFDGSFNGEYTEEMQRNPMSAYGRTKAEGERRIENIIESYYIIRTAWLYGIYGNNFVKTMLRLFRERSEVGVVADQWGSPTYTRDLAGCIIMILQADNDKFGIYHFTNEGRTCWYDFSREIYALAKKMGSVNQEVHIKPLRTEDYPTKALRPKNSYLSKEKVKSSFNLTIRDWQNALKDFMKRLEEKDEKF